MRKHWEWNGTPLTLVAKETSTASKMANKESDAQEYLKKHRIMELFENLTAQLIYDRPGEYFDKQLLDIYVAEMFC